MTGTSELAAWVEKLADARVLVAGDVMLDRYIYGSISRISPEAPVPVFRSERVELMLGGAGNVVRNLVSLGAKVSFISLIGDDPEGGDLERLLSCHEGVRPRLIVEPNRPSTLKTRFVAERQQVLRADSETTRPLSNDSFEQAVRLLDESVSNAAVILLSDYGKGFLSAPLISRLILKARSLGRPVLVDPKGTDWGRYRGAHLLTPNLKELCEASGKELQEEDDIVAAAQAMILRHELHALLVTRGAQGMTLVEGHGDVSHFRAQAREIFDVSGAGDTVISTLAAALAGGTPLPEAVELANTAAGIVVGKIGTAVSTPAELLKAVHRHELNRAENKIATLEEAVDQVARWRAKGDRIGFTNGVFDLLHHGHLSLFKQAAEICDRLIVGLNADDSVRKIRGDGPIQLEATRSAILAALEVVDLVVLFHDEEPLQLLRQLRPDFLIKGNNYAPGEIVGAELVQSWGGEVVQAEIAEVSQKNHTLHKILNGSL